MRLTITTLTLCSCFGCVVTADPPEKNRSDCEEVLVYVDADGDGVASSPAPDDSNALTICADEEIPSGYAREGDDCDDSDPTRWKWRCVDRDGDGAVSFQCTTDDDPEAFACPIIVEWTPEPGPYDCDDDDPTRIDYFYRDNDLDGYGSGEAVCWRPEPGWSAWGGDCNDDDPTIHPLAVEYFGDGVDSDCDGKDSGVCLPRSLDEMTWPESSGEPSLSCDGPDLALGFVSCSSCYLQSATFAVENRGNVAFDGEVVLDGSGVSVFVRLDPGERRLLVSGPFSGAFVLNFADDFLDCNPSDNGVSVSGGHCI